MAISMRFMASEPNTVPHMVATPLSANSARPARLRAAPSPVLDAYGASDPAEFFAVATEAFIERPQALADEAPALYDALARLYRLDPRAWQPIAP